MLYLDCPALQHGVLEDGDCTCEWVNEDCPAQCRTDHDEPEPGTSWSYHHRDYGTWKCPETGERFRYCSMCSDHWTPMSRWDNNPVEINGEWYCDPYEHGMRSCDDCGDYHDEDDMSWFSRRSEWDEDILLCSDCYAGAMQAQREEESSGERVTTCSSCGTGNVHMDEYTETFVCKCAADKLREAKRPVMVAA